MVNVKKELAKLDRDDFTKVCYLVDKIVRDIWITSQAETNAKWQDELKMAMIKDYMIDLINPDLLDFDKEEI
jgi:hypothetical protein